MTIGSVSVLALELAQPLGTSPKMACAGLINY